MYPLFWYIALSPLKGAQTTLHVAMEDWKKLKGGSFYKNLGVAKHNKLMDDKKEGEQLWEFTKALLEKKGVQIKEF